MSGECVRMVKSLVDAGMDILRAVDLVSKAYGIDYYSLQLMVKGSSDLYH